ncbi:hypothetical protein ACFX13_013599 [Malus domestica]
MPFATGLHFPRYASSSDAIESINTVPANNTETPPLHHPWPKWVPFVDHLKAKRYFTRMPPKESDGYTNINEVKKASFSFARDCYDVFKLLSMEDIQVVAEGGCPNLCRKAMNLAKILRFHLRLDEGEVYGGCNLRGSCDRAYVILKESEAAARTVGIVQILLF